MFNLLLTNIEYHDIIFTHKFSKFVILANTSSGRNVMPFLPKSLKKESYNMSTVKVTETVKNCTIENRTDEQRKKANISTYKTNYMAKKIETHSSLRFASFAKILSGRNVIPFEEKSLLNKKLLH